MSNFQNDVAFSQDQQEHELFDDDDNYEDELPWYMYCQPCQSTNQEQYANQQNQEGSFNDSSKNGYLHSIDEDEPLQDGTLVSSTHAGHDAYYNEHNDVDDLDHLPFTLQSMMEDSPTSHRNTSTTTTTTPSQLDQSFQQYVVSRKPQAVTAAMTLTQSFGTGIYQPNVERSSNSNNNRTTHSNNNDNGNGNKDGSSSPSGQQQQQHHHHNPQQETSSYVPPNARQCLGHNETIYGISFSSCGQFLATASQDATICIWNTSRNSLLHKLKGHNPDSECLRVAWASTSWGDDALDRSDKHKYVLASSGADGIVKLWSTSDPGDTDKSWTCLVTLDHAAILSKKKQQHQQQQQVQNQRGEESNHSVHLQDDENDEPPQVYALQFINHWKGIADGDFQDNNFLMTSSDDYIHLWEIGNDFHPTPGAANGDDAVITKDLTKMNANDNKMKNMMMMMDSIRLVEVLSIRFTCLDDFGYGVSVTTVTDQGLLKGIKDDEMKEAKRARLMTTTTTTSSSSSYVPFGGERNPHNIIYVFDASYCSMNGLLGVALSDGSLRLVNGRGICVCPLTLPGNKSHMTSFGWDTSSSSSSMAGGCGGTRLASCVATGHLILWSITIHDNGTVSPSCLAVLDGGHEPGRPLYGAAYYSSFVSTSSSSSSSRDIDGKGGKTDGGKDGNGTKEGVVSYYREEEDLILSWGVDGRLCLWDAHSTGNIHTPLATLVSQSEYPIFAVDISVVPPDSSETTAVTTTTTTTTIPKDDEKNNDDGDDKSDHSTEQQQLLARIACGGGREGGFIGVPVYLFDVTKGIESSMSQKLLTRRKVSQK